MLGSVNLLSSAVGSLLTPQILWKFGRRKSILLGLFFWFIGIFIILFWSDSVPIIMTSMIIMSLMNITLQASYIYATELLLEIDRIRFGKLSSYHVALV